MKISYKKLWKLLIDRDMKKKDLAEQSSPRQWIMYHPKAYKT